MCKLAFIPRVFVQILANTSKSAKYFAKIRSRQLVDRNRIVCNH
jgi:hypothetical protein